MSTNSASSTHDASYLTFEICALHPGQVLNAFFALNPQAEQMNSSAFK
jgi:hypothetical protein